MSSATVTSNGHVEVPASTRVPVSAPLRPALADVARAALQSAAGGVALRADEVLDAIATRCRQRQVSALGVAELRELAAVIRCGP